ncbi:hypothetical protein C1645_818660 [Glomus cerebriforme]|uniref:Sel1 repeat family protein n=1 Tax=Glomus cerebriforme TaxID=658196 RepID=A0A397T6R4_9GLOM|nr:hypothetical protein C1645_818660 [Glomus cerebriforme]
MPPANPIWAHFNKLERVAGYFGPSTQQRNNSYSSTEQNNIVVIKRPVSQSQATKNNFVDRISSAEQAEGELLFAQAVYQLNNLVNSADYICLISDGWSNIMQEHWANYLIATPKPVFFSAHQTGEISQSYEYGIGIEKDLRKTAFWYEKGNGVGKDYQKAYELFKKLAEGEYLRGITMLEYCYNMMVSNLV